MGVDVHGAPAEGVAAPVLLPPDAVAVEGVAATPTREHARRERERSWVRACAGVDALMLGTAITTAEFGAGYAHVPSTPGVWLVLFALLTAAGLATRGLYAQRLSLRALQDVRAIATAAGFAALTLLAVRALFFPDPAAADQLVRLFAFATAFVAGGRVVLFWSEAAARRRGETLRPTLIVGAGRVGRLAAKRLLGHRELGLAPVGFADAEPAEGSDPLPLPVLGNFEELDRIVEEHGIEQVVITFSRTPDAGLLRIASRCEELGVRYTVVPRFFDRMSERVKVDHVLGLPLLSADLPNPRGWQFAVKHAIDRVAASLLLALLSPVLVAAAIAVRLSLGRPILFRQTRVGRDGRTFDMLKFRTMRPPTALRVFRLEPDTAPGGVEGDDRRTRVGDFLRRTSIDELPQLLNVVKGEMSLIGPRPERPEFVDVFAETVDRYDDRHRVKSGITGWAQVHGLRGKTSISERAELDNYYVQNWSLWLDVKIALMTAATVVMSFRSVE